MSAQWWTRVAAVVIGVWTIASMGGCYAGAWYASSGIPLTGISLTPAAAAFGAIPSAYATTQIKHGPTASFHNESESRLAVRYWVGKTDYRAPGGVADWRSPAAFELDPGETKRVQLGRKGWFTANSDAVVRVQISAVVPADAAPDQIVLMEAGPYWYELEKPAPYSMKAVGPREALAFETCTEGGLKPLDRSEWFERCNDDFPARNVAQVGAAEQLSPG